MTSYFKSVSITDKRIDKNIIIEYFYFLIIIISRGFLNI